ncbi:MAG: hypothetical protein JO227_06355 [Acetobacteraceae bacterium]|nr:hypothetical protein [Acetobacteraceae bacterium]
MGLITALRRTRESANIALAPTPGPLFGLRGPFLRWCLAKAIPDAKQPITQVRLERFLIGAQPDLSGCKLEVRVVFAGCRFTAPVDLTGAEIAGIAFVASDVPRILADRAMMKGSLLIRTDADVPGHLR